MRIQNGQIFTEDAGFKTGSIDIDGNRIRAVSYTDTPDKAGSIDATGLYVIPGLTEIHFHGCKGYDFCTADEKGLEEMAKYQLSRGITQICPTSMTLSEESLTRAFKMAAEYNRKEHAGAKLVGINMEGPFISYEKKAAQNGKYIVKPDVDTFLRLQAAADGLIKLCDIAPETEGAMDFIKRLHKDVHISLAHSTAGYDMAMAAFEAGADHVTHLYNAMNPFLHRHPGIVGAASDSEKVFVEMIGDCLHLSPSVCRATLKMIGDDRLCLISDSIEACGMPDGQYMLGGLEATKAGDKVCLTGTDTLAGSAVDLMSVMVSQVKLAGIPLTSAVKCAAVNPAKSIGIYDDYGSIVPGKFANIVLLNKELEIAGIIYQGRLLD